MPIVLKSASIMAERPSDFCPKCWELIKGCLLLAEWEIAHRATWGPQVLFKQDRFQERGPRLMHTPLDVSLGSRWRPETPGASRTWWLPSHEILADLAAANVRRRGDGTFDRTVHLTVINTGIKRGHHRAFSCELPEGLLRVSGPTAAQYIQEKLEERARLLAAFEVDIAKELAWQQAQDETAQQKAEGRRRYAEAIQRFARAAGVEADIVATRHGEAMAIRREDLDRIAERLERRR